MTSARYPDGFQYPNKKPARYTDNKINSYFTGSGITQLGYIRYQLEGLIATTNNTHTQKQIEALINIIDGLADKGRLTTVTIGKRIDNLDKDLMKVFPMVDGALVFSDPLLLKAAKIIAQGIQAIEPGDLSPPKPLLAAVGKNNVELCRLIKSSMNTLGAQINFLIQLQSNAEMATTLYETMDEIEQAEKSLTQVIQLDTDNKKIIDLRKNNHQGAEISAFELISRINPVITDINRLIKNYLENPCTAITLRGRGQRLTPLETFSLMLSSPRSLTHISNEGYDANDAVMIYPVFMATTVPFFALQACKSIKTILEQLEMIVGNDRGELGHTKQIFTGLLATLEGALQRLTQSETPTLRNRLTNFRSTFCQALSDYQEGDITKKIDAPTNKAKLSISSDLIKQLNNIKLNDDFLPERELSDIISTLAKAYYQHNDYCIEDSKSPGKLGLLLVEGMNDLATMSASISAGDSANHYKNLTEIQELQNKVTHHPSPRPQ